MPKLHRWIENVVNINETKNFFVKTFKKGILTNKESELIVKKLIERYKHLRKEDQLKLIQNHFTPLENKNVKEIYNFVNKKEVDEIDDEQEKKKRFKLWKFRKPAYLQQKSSKKKTVTELGIDEYNDKSCTAKEKELEEIEKYTLIEDLFKSYIYGKSFTLLNDQYSTKNKICNDFIYVMINTIRQNILENIRPALINEFASYKNPYMLFKHSLFNYILYRYVKNPYEETLIENYINRKIQLNILKITSASVPPEVFEPLVSFRGDVHYNYNLKQKFEECVNTSYNILNLLIKQKNEKEKGEKQETAEYDSLVNEVLKLLPENQKYHFENYPFENLKSFRTNIRKKYIGGIKNNKPLNIEEEQLLDMRYPNLQCVAHSLPTDVKYRDNVIHAIKVLERSKYWDHKSKIKAISLLIEVWNNMCSSEHYENVLDKALPVIYKKDMLKKTRTRKDTYNRGLKYIQSLTTQKPLSARLKK